MTKRDSVGRIPAPETKRGNRKTQNRGKGKKFIKKSCEQLDKRRSPRRADSNTRGHYGGGAWTVGGCFGHSSTGWRSRRSLVDHSQLLADGRQSSTDARHNCAIRSVTSSGKRYNSSTYVLGQPDDLPSGRHRALSCLQHPQLFLPFLDETLRPFPERPRASEWQ